jgi:hypothetical protein
MTACTERRTLVPTYGLDREGQKSMPEGGTA